MKMKKQTREVRVLNTFTKHKKGSTYIVIYINEHYNFF